MIYPENDELNQYPRYILALLAAERARLLVAGAKPLVPVNGTEFNPLSVALEEIAQGKIRLRITDDNRVEVVIQGSEVNWALTDLRELKQREAEEDEESQEIQEFFEQETGYPPTEGSEPSLGDVGQEPEE